MVDEDVVAGHVVQDTLMFTNPIDSDPHTADKDTATYNDKVESGIKVVARIHAGNQKDPSERNKGLAIKFLFLYLRIKIGNILQK